MMKNIAIITGGDSSEIVISLRSAEQVRSCLDKNKYESYIVFIQEDDWHVDQPDGKKIRINRHDFSFMRDGKKIEFDFAFFAMHGPPGEDGKLQAYLDLLHIPYSTSGVLSLALTFNKYSTKMFLSQFGIKTAKSILLKRGTTLSSQEIKAKLGLPCFIKPNCGGSSFGVSKISQADELQEAIQSALNEDDQVLVEEFIYGPELTCGLIKLSDQKLIFPVTEIISKKEFFDYEAKYTEGMADEITPARIPDKLAEKCQNLASQIYDLVNCKGIVRIDFINHKEELYFLELNGIPGMTAESIVPKMIRAYGMTEQEVYQKMIEDFLG